MAGSSKQPKAPDPNKLISEQTASNLATAQTEKTLNSNNQVDQYGNTVTNVKDPKTGQWTTTQALSPEEQATLDREKQFGAMSANTGMQLLGNTSDMYGKPIDLSGANIGGEITDRLAPQFQAERERQRLLLDSTLANKGIKQGDPAYQSAMRDFDANQNDAWDRQVTSARGQIVNEMVLGRQLPMQEMSWLTGQDPLHGPSFTNVPQVNVGGVNTAQIQQQNYDNLVAAKTAKDAQTNAMMSGLFGLGGAVIGGTLGGPMGASIGSSLGGGLAGLGGAKFPSGASVVGPGGYY